MIYFWENIKKLNYLKIKAKNLKFYKKNKS